jgi:DNA-binding winged helix-turn-helix (wHTH) protein
MQPTKGYRFGDFVLDVPQKRLQQADGSALELTPRVFAALVLLVEHAGLLVERERLLYRVWPGLVVGKNSLSQVIVTLRRTLGDAAQGSRFIQTVLRRGFRFIAPVTPVTDVEFQERPDPVAQSPASGRTRLDRSAGEAL